MPDYFVRYIDLIDLVFDDLAFDDLAFDGFLIVRQSSIEIKTFNYLQIIMTSMQGYMLLLCLLIAPTSQYKYISLAEYMNVHSFWLNRYQTITFNMTWNNGNDIDFKFL